MYELIIILYLALYNINILYRYETSGFKTACPIYFLLKLSWHTVNSNTSSFFFSSF